MLKLASLSLAALLFVVSPAFAAPSQGDPAPACIAPERFGPQVTRIEGAKLVELREISADLPAEVDLVIVLRTAPVMIAFAQGCAIASGSFEVEPAAPGSKI